MEVLSGAFLVAGVMVEMAALLSAALAPSTGWKNNINQ